MTNFVRYIMTIIAVGCLVPLSSAWAQCDDGEAVIKFGLEELVKESARFRSAQLLQRLVNVEMQGKACVEIITDPQKYADHAILSKLEKEDVQLAAPAFSALSGQHSSYSVFSIPFAFDDQSALNRFQSDRVVIQNLANSIGKKATLLGFWYGGFQQLSAKRLLINPEDVLGLKFYSTNEASRQLAIALKSVPIQVSEKEVGNSLKEGRIEAISSSWLQLSDANLHEYLGGVSETNHVYDGFQLVASSGWWSKLDKGVKSELTGILIRASREANRLASFRDQQAKRKVIRSGKPVIALTKTQRDRWRAAAAKNVTAIAQSIDAELIRRLRLSNRVR